MNCPKAWFLFIIGRGESDKAILKETQLSTM